MVQSGTTRRPFSSVIQVKKMSQWARKKLWACPVLLTSADLIVVKGNKAMQVYYLHVRMFFT